MADLKEFSSFAIYDISRKKMFSESAKSSKLELNLSQLKDGIYVVKAKSDRQVKTLKFIKK